MLTKLISIEKEVADTHILSSSILEEGWVDRDTVIVNCSPDYSSIVSQILNHRLSHSHSNELMEMLPMEMPYPNMSQVFDPIKGNYILFDKYIYEWANENLFNYEKFLFLDSAVVRGKNFSKLRAIIKPKISSERYRFAALYLHNQSVFTPDYYVEKYNGELIFSWENPLNPNW